MNKLNKMLCAACTLAMANIGLAQADSSNFAGPYVGLQMLGLGAEFQGTGSSSAGTSAAETDKVLTNKKIKKKIKLLEFPSFIFFITFF